MATKLSRKREKNNPYRHPMTCGINQDERATLYSLYLLWLHQVVIVRRKGYSTLSDGIQEEKNGIETNSYRHQAESQSNCKTRNNLHYNRQFTHSLDFFGTLQQNWSWQLSQTTYFIWRLSPKKTRENQGSET